MYPVLIDAGEISHPPEGERIKEDGPEFFKMLMVAKACAVALGFNKAANEKFGEGNWKL